MTRSLEPAGASPGNQTPSSLHARVLLWSGALLCLGGIVSSRMWEHWAAGRFAELLVLSLGSVAAAWPLRRFARWSWAGALAAIWFFALAVFAGLVPLLAVLLLATAALASGSLIAAPAPLALRCACGLALVAGVAGWLLPLPIHGRWTYAAMCIALILKGRRALLTDLDSVRSRWANTVSDHPVYAACAVLALGLASTACWLPTMQFDDLAYHLGLPWQLMETGRYALDPSRQVWALAPWAADVQQAIPQLLAGSEARGPLNALWITLTASGLWHLGRSLGGGSREAWLGVALYGSLPLTAGLAGGMQTEPATTALLVWVAWLIVARDARTAFHGLWPGAILVGGLLGLKLMAAACTLVMLAWAMAVVRPFPRTPALIGATALAAIIGLSSYVYSTVVTGNPFLPLLNGVFSSPYFAASNFDDPRWHAGLTPLLPWHMTFATQDYVEGFPGTAGFALVGLAGAWLASLAQPGLRVAAVATGALVLLPLVPLQYLRYAFPGMVLLLPIMVAAARRVDPRHGALLIGAVCVLNLAFQANGHWMLRTGATKQALLSLGSDNASFLEYAPERLLIARIRGSERAPQVLFMDASEPRYAELGGHGRTIAWYDPTMMRAAAQADRDQSGQRWATLWRQHAITDVVVRKSRSNPARAAALLLAGAQRRGAEGDVEWWHLPAGTSQ